MNCKIILPFLLLFLAFGCGGDDTADNRATGSENPATGTQLKLGIQEVHFSQISEVEGWGFADLDEAKQLFDYMDDLKISTFRYTIFWTCAELYEKNNFDWTRHDALIDYLRGKGINLTVTLFGDHYKYVGDGSSPYPGHSVPEYWDAWLNYVEKAVTRYGDKVARWEIWNEPDFAVSGSGIFWKPVVAPDDFSAMLIGTAQKIKAIHPGAKVVMGGVTNFNGYRSFLQTCFNNGVLDYIDEIGVHLYRTRPEGPFNFLADTTVDVNPDLAGIQSPATIEEEIVSLRAFIDSFRKGFPIRNTEEGFHIGPGLREDNSQMKYLTRMILVEHSLGLGEITCFRLRAPRRSDFPAGVGGDSSYTEAAKFPGIIDQEADGSFTPRPAYYAIKNMAQYLAGPEVFYQRSLVIDSGGYKVRLEIYSKNELPVIAYWVDEAICDTEKAAGSVAVTIDGIGNHAYKVVDIKDNGTRTAGSYSPSGGGVAFGALPITDYPFILVAE